MKKIIHYLKLINNVGFKIGWCSFIYSISAKLHNKYLQYYFMDKKDTAIISYLKESLKEELDKIQKIDKILESKEESNNHPKYIWVFWASDKIPDIVQSCLYSIKQYAEDMQLIIVNLHNYDKYVSLDSVIYEKFKSGSLSITHFSDVLRMKLLYEYGGIWLDCTMIQTKPWNIEWFKYPLFTQKMVHNKSCVPSPSKGMISSFFWISQPRCTFFKAMYDLFVAYWNKHDMLIDYLLIDYFWVLITDSSPICKQAFMCLPDSNPNIYRLSQNKNKLLSEDEFLALIDDNNTILYKLSYKKLSTLSPSNSNLKLNMREMIIHHYHNKYGS